MQEDFAIFGLKPGPKQLTPGRFAAQRGQGVLDVLASAERVRGKIGTGAMVVADLSSPNDDPIGTARLRIDDLEVGEDRMIAEIAQPEFLLPAELPAQLDLPGFERHALGAVQGRKLGLARFGLFLFRWFANVVGMALLVELHCHDWLSVRTSMNERNDEEIIVKRIEISCGHASGGERSFAILTKTIGSSS